MTDKINRSGFWARVFQSLRDLASPPSAVTGQNPASSIELQPPSPPQRDPEKDALTIRTDIFKHTSTISIALAGANATLLFTKAQDFSSLSLIFRYSPARPELKGIPSKEKV